MSDVEPPEKGREPPEKGREPPEKGREPPARPGPPPLNGAAFVGMGLSAASTVAVGTVLGDLADAYFHTAPWLLLAGIAVGLVGAIASVVALVKRYL